VRERDFTIKLGNGWRDNGVAAYVLPMEYFLAPMYKAENFQQSENNLVESSQIVFE